MSDDKKEPLSNLDEIPVASTLDDIEDIPQADVKKKDESSEPSSNGLEVGASEAPSTGIDWKPAVPRERGIPFRQDTITPTLDIPREKPISVSREEKIPKPKEPEILPDFGPETKPQINDLLTEEKKEIGRQIAGKTFELNTGDRPEDIQGGGKQISFDDIIYKEEVALMDKEYPGQQNDILKEHLHTLKITNPSLFQYYFTKSQKEGLASSEKLRFEQQGLSLAAENLARDLRILEDRGEVNEIKAYGDQVQAINALVEQYNQQPSPDLEAKIKEG